MPTPEENLLHALFDDLPMCEKCLHPSHEGHCPVHEETGFIDMNQNKYESQCECGLNNED
jgi:hypothetical protein